MKFCSKCQTEKPVESFSRSKGRPDGRNPYCQACNTEGMRIWREKYPERNDVYQRKFKLKQFGMTLEDYIELLDKQNGVCAICGTDNPGHGGVKRSFDVDHNHRTGKVRGLLCQACNMGIGQLGDDPKLLRKAADYLENQ